MRYWFGGAYIWRGSFMEGLIFGILRYNLVSRGFFSNLLVSCKAVTAMREAARDGPSWDLD